MIYATNILIILFVALIAYWWGNQGAFSALLHLLCVVTAGALALALWEPITVNLLLRGSGFDNYAWGVVLVGVFAVLLAILRVAADKLVPNNLDFPTWANLAFGLPLGALAGIITMGIFVIGAGHLQTSYDMLGFRDWQRSDRTGEITQISGGRLWLPVHQITDEFYSWLSITSLRTGRPLRHYTPDLFKNATLVRDSYFEQARGSVSMVPGAVRIRNAYCCGDLGRYALRVSFTADARDFASQLTMSSSQIRLIGNGRGTGKAPYSFPDRWSQDTRSGERNYFFDSVTAYITSVPARETTDLILRFPAPDGDQCDARFLMLKGTRFALPRIEAISGDDWRSVVGGLSVTDVSSSGDAFTGGDITVALNVSNKLRMIRVGTNQLPAGLKERDKFLIEGEATIKSGGERPPRALQIKGIFEEPGTHIVQLNISRDSPANVFGDARNQVADDATFRLVDTAGHSYTPIGYVFQNSLGTTIKLAPRSYVRTIDEIPVLPRAGSQRLTLLFRITEGVTLDAFRWGDLTIGTCNMRVVPTP